jgi:site-specific DNA-methyltransferase (adenine-specific)
MAARLVELHRVLKPTGSLYLHCDPTASHYLKVVLDAIFGPENFRNEIVWTRHNARSVVQRIWPRLHDVILWYSREHGPSVWTPTLAASSKSSDPHDIVTWEDGERYRTKDLTGQGVRTGETGQPWRGMDPTPKGRHWRIRQAALEQIETEGRLYWQKNGFPRERAEEPYVPDERQAVVGDVWTDIDSINAGARERLGYPTQKPAALLERIIAASSNPGDIVLDPFCGCGTALVAAEKLGRKWIGIDITYLSIAVMKARLKDSFGLDDIEVIGQPTEVEGARQLAVDHESRYQFQWWALGLIDAQPIGGVQKMGADKGIDGRITFTDEHGTLEQVLVSVKSGHVDASQIRDLKGTIERENAAIGIFVTLEEPTRNMREEAATAGAWHSNVWNRDYPRIQMLSIRDLLEEHRKPDLPTFVHAPYQRAERVETSMAAEQRSLFTPEK